MLRPIKKNASGFMQIISCGKINGMLTLFHAGFSIIKEPDVHIGRKNADFGQGFYLTSDAAFAHRWARERKGEQTIVNTYELDTNNLSVRCFIRGEEWFEYIFKNRNNYSDELNSDVIIGPIANDTIYDTFGIITSGFLKREDALRLLQIGPAYEQVALKSDKAVKHLKWISSEVLLPDTVAEYRKLVAEEEKKYQELFAEEMERISLSE